MAARIFKDIDHVLIAPDLSLVVACQVREPVQVIVVHVTGHGNLYGLHAKAGLQIFNIVLHEANPICRRRGPLKIPEVKARSRAIINEHGLAAIAQDGIER